MSIVTRCKCKKAYKVPDRYATKHFRCKKCGRTLQIPALSASRASLKPRKMKVRPGRTYQRPSDASSRISETEARLRVSERRVVKLKRGSRLKSDRAPTERPIQDRLQKKPRRRLLRKLPRTRRGEGRSKPGAQKKEKSGSASQRLIDLLWFRLAVGLGVGILVLSSWLLFAGDGGAEERSAFSARLTKAQKILDNGFLEPGLKILDELSARSAELDLSADADLKERWDAMHEVVSPLQALLLAGADLAGPGWEKVVEATRHDRPEVRFQAVRILGKSEKREAGQALLPLSDERDDRVRTAVRRALLKHGVDLYGFGEEELLTWALEALQKEQGQHWDGALQRLLDFKSPRAVKAVAESLDKVYLNPSLLLHAVEYLEDASDREIIPILEKFAGRYQVDPGTGMNQEQWEALCDEVDMIVKNLSER